MLSSLAAEYPDMPGRGRLDSPQDAIYIARSAFDITTVTDRVGADITVVDIGGGLGLFSLGMAKLGANSILVDDFAWLRAQPFGKATFALLERHGVRVIERDVIADGLGVDEPLHAVTNFHFMEHAHNSPKKLFRDVAARLAPGGVFVHGGPNCVNLRKRITVPLGRGQWSTMQVWYETPAFRGHVREPDVATLRYIATDLGLVSHEIFGRNFLAAARPGRLGQLYRAVDPVLRRWPGLCSDIYLAARKAPLHPLPS